MSANSTKIEQARMRRFVAETPDPSLQRQLLESQREDVYRTYEAHHLKTLTGGDVEVRAKELARHQANLWLNSKLNKLNIFRAGAAAPLSNPAPPKPVKSRDAPKRLEQHVGLVARACAAVMELEGAITKTVSRTPEPHDSNELLRRRSHGCAEELVTVNGDCVETESLVDGQPTMAQTPYIISTPLWSRRSGVVRIVIKQVPQALDPLRERLADALRYAGIVVLASDMQNSIVAQCLFEMGIAIVWLDTDADGDSLLRRIDEEDHRSFTAGALAELRGALTYVDHVIGDLNGDKAALALHSGAAKAKVKFDENTPLASADPVIMRIEERCKRELDDYIEWAGDQMHVGLSRLAMEVKQDILDKDGKDVLKEVFSPGRSVVKDGAPQAPKPQESANGAASAAQELTDKDGRTLVQGDSQDTAESHRDVNRVATATQELNHRDDIAPVKGNVVRKTISEDLIETVVAKATADISRLQETQQEAARKFWGDRLRDGIIRQSLRTVPSEARESVDISLKDEFFRAVDGNSEERLRSNAIGSFREAIREQIAPIEVPKEPNALTPLTYMRKVVSQVMGGIGTVFVVLSLFGLGLTAVMNWSGIKDSPLALVAGILLTVAIYPVASTWAKRDHARANHDAAVKVKVATIKIHAAALDRFEAAWRRNFAVNLKASLRDTLRRVKSDLRDEVAKYTTEEAGKRTAHAKEADDREKQIAKLDATANQATRVRAQLLEQHKQLVKVLEQELAQGALS